MPISNAYVHVVCDTCGHGEHFPDSPNDEYDGWRVEDRVCTCPDCLEKEIAAEEAGQ